MVRPLAGFDDEACIPQFDKRPRWEHDSDENVVKACSVD